jgi:hypothetical protein
VNLQTKPTSSQKAKKLLEQVSDAIRVKHYSSRTEKTYTDWIKRYILFHNKRHPKDMGTQIYTHVLQRGGLAVRSPLDE